MSRTIEFKVSRETDDDSRDYTVEATFVHDAYHIEVDLTPESEALVGKLTDSEKDRVFELIRELDGEDE